MREMEMPTVALIAAPYVGLALGFIGLLIALRRSFGMMTDREFYRQWFWFGAGFGAFALALGVAILLAFDLVGIGGAIACAIFASAAWVGAYRLIPRAFGEPT